MCGNRAGNFKGKRASGTSKPIFERETSTEIRKGDQNEVPRFRTVLFAFYFQFRLALVSSDNLPRVWNKWFTYPEQRRTNLRASKNETLNAFVANRGLATIVKLLAVEINLYTCLFK